MKARVIALALVQYDTQLKSAVHVTDVMLLARLRCYVVSACDACNLGFIVRSHLGGQVRALPPHASVYNVFC